ncbi:MAG: SDR family NAD(P)-dependent oxidoreductase [Pirellulaceae bacterium]|nr:SDR family NAD(P)-dependent oxidoreductase [Pirellulaceae bacterium]
MNEQRFLRGKFALVIGGSRGIGRGIALQLAERGAAVAVNYLQDEIAARDTLARIQEHGGME